MNSRDSWWILFLLLGCGRPAAGQQTELLLRGGVNATAFFGPGATDALTIKGDFYDAATPPASHIDPFLRNPYSRRVGLGFSLGLRVQRVRSQGGIIAWEAGLDQAVSGHQVAVFDGTPKLWAGPYQLTEPATGRAGLTRWVIPVFVGVGHRWRAGSKRHLDVVVGPELGWVVAAHEKGQGTHSGRYTPTDTPWDVHLSRHLQHHLDWRVRADATFWVDRLGLNATYGWGLTNLQPELEDLTQFYVSAPVHTQLLRVGIAYRLR